MDLTFLDKVEMEDLEGKDEKIQPVRFNKDEFYMLKFVNFKNKRFATYIKELIEKDIKEYLSNTDNTNITNSSLSIDLEQLKEELKEEIKEELTEEIRAKLLEELKEELKEKLDNMDLKQENIDESKNDLLNFMNNRK
ncbi:MULTISPECIES: hypothetical protein [Clostridium]|uniref:hypothetical protein n=1 Tax=Clostridium TaxID=1485 RepID=UPI001A29AB05|nr:MULTISPECIES: hypothetical protein [Clostridium]MDU7016767.1 hypothetical protein [Enterobacter sp.]EGT0681984.1 hypothetical protein [Clostridium perfringens]MDU2094946.1 hypothetical protein [Clostridium perfringens]MDU2227947.1 hypothetical protein [Clostridium perfringens]MDU4145913.1 hypothetical protein [Clostridium sp.]